MKGLAPLFLGIFGTFAFSWVGLTLIPNWQIGHLNPQSDEEGTDIYPMPQSGMVQRGARVYAANGCIYCHSEQVHAEYAGADIERKWGDRRSAPRDYIFERPVFLGKMRMGQDLANIGARAPKEEESPAPAGGASPAAAAPAQPQGAAVSSPPPSAVGSPSPASSPATTPAASPGSTAPKGPTSPAPAAPPPSKSPAAAAAAGASPAASPSPSVPPHRGPSKPRACHRSIPLPGIMCIFIRREVSTSIRTCPPIGFFTKLAVSMTRAHRMRYSSPVPTPRLRDGRSFQLTMRNVLSHT